MKLSARQNTALSFIQSRSIVSSADVEIAGIAHSTVRALEKRELVSITYTPGSFRTHTAYGRVPAFGSSYHVKPVSQPAVEDVTTKKVAAMLNKTARIVLSALILEATSGADWIATRTLPQAFQLNRSTATVRRYLKQLVELGLADILKKKDGDHDNDVFFCNCDGIADAIARGELALDAAEWKAFRGAQMQGDSHDHWCFFESKHPAAAEALGSFLVWSSTPAPKPTAPEPTTPAPIVIAILDVSPINSNHKGINMSNTKTIMVKSDTDNDREYAVKVDADTHKAISCNCPASVPCKHYLRAEVKSSGALQRAGREIVRAGVFPSADIFWTFFHKCAAALTPNEAILRTLAIAELLDGGESVPAELLDPRFGVGGEVASIPAAGLPPFEELEAVNDDAEDSSRAVATDKPHGIAKALGEAFGEDGKYGTWSNSANTNARFADIVSDDKLEAVAATVREELEAEALADANRGRIEACDLGLEAMPQAERVGPCLASLREAGGDIRVEVVPVTYLDGTHHKALERFRIVRDADTGYPFLQTSDRWATPQHADVARMMDAVVEGGALEGIESPEIACSVANSGGHVWWKASVSHFTDDEILSADVLRRVERSMPDLMKQVMAGGLKPKGLDFGFKLMCSHSVDGSALTWAAMIDVEACSNKARVALAGFCGKIRHTTNAPRRVEALRAMFNKAPQLGIKLRDMVARLAFTPVDTKTLDDFAKVMFPKETASAERKRKELVTNYHDAPGAVPGSAWGLVQAVTYHTTHNQRVHTGGRAGQRFSLDSGVELEAAAREYSSMFGRGDTLNQKALAYVLSL